MYIFVFCSVVDIYVGFAPASSNLSSPSYNSPRSTQECTHLLRTFHAFCHYTLVLPNILLVEEFGQCPLASSRRDIMADRAGVRPLANRMLHHVCGMDCHKKASYPVSQCHIALRTLYYWFWNVSYQHHVI
jgi:hypothetical protein